MKYPQEGRDYIGAYMLEVYRPGAKQFCGHLPGPVTRQFMQPFLE